MSRFTRAKILEQFGSSLLDSSLIQLVVKLYSVSHFSFLSSHAHSTLSFFSSPGPITPQGTGFLAVQTVGGIKVRHQHMMVAQEQPGSQLQFESPVQQPQPDERLPFSLGLILSYFPSGQFPHCCHRSGSGPGQICYYCEETQTDWIPL